MRIILTGFASMLLIGAAGMVSYADDAAPESTSGGPTSAECAEFARDDNADLGEVLRAGCEPTLAQMSALMDNPLGNVAMLFQQYDSYRMENGSTGREAIQNNYMGIFQFPKGISENWNLINRIIYNVPSLPIDLDNADFGSGPGGPIPPSGSPPAPIDLFEGRTTGFGDMYYVGLFAPKKAIDFEGGGKGVWGVGFDAGFPTASDEVLGLEKWTAGPSALYAYLGPKLKVGALVQQYWDYAGDDDRSDVSLMNLQYLAYWSLNETTSVGAAPNIIANWEQSSGNKWTVPIGFGINKTVNLGKLPVRFGVEAFYSVVQPDDVVGTDWSWRFYMIPAVPSAMFKWME